MRIDDKGTIALSLQELTDCLNAAAVDIKEPDSLPQLDDGLFSVEECLRTAGELGISTGSLNQFLALAEGLAVTRRLIVDERLKIGLPGDASKLHVQAELRIRGALAEITDNFPAAVSAALSKHAEYIQIPVPTVIEDLRRQRFREELDLYEQYGHASDEQLSRFEGPCVADRLTFPDFGASWFRINVLGIPHEHKKLSILQGALRILNTGSPRPREIDIDTIQSPSLQGLFQVARNLGVEIQAATINAVEIKLVFKSPEP